jgi:hypothetical protein
MEITPVPDSDASIRGVINLRGKIIPVKVVILLSIPPPVGLSVYFAASQRQLAVSWMQRHLEMQARAISRPASTVDRAPEVAHESHLLLR